MPPIVLNVLFAVAVVFGFKPTRENVNKLLKDNFIQKMTDFDVEIITGKLHKSLDKYVHMKEFTPQMVSRQSAAACYLCEWILEVHHIDVHDKLLDVKLEEDVAQLKEDLSKCKHFNEQLPKFVSHKRPKSMAIMKNET